MSVIDPKTVLSVLDRLWPRNAELELDEIDGWFYWECCRADVGPRIRELLREIHDQKPSTKEEQERFLEQLRAVERYIRALQSTVPGLEDWMFEQRPPRMRGGTFSVWHGAGIDPEDVRSSTSSGWLRLGVLNRAWTGAMVEEEVRRRTEASEGQHHDFFRSHMDPDAERSQTEYAMSFVFRFQQPGSVLARSESFSIVGDLPPVILESPLVYVIASYPLPPKGVLTTAYDAIVRHEREWHSQLWGTIQGQEPDVAIRTWAVALLSQSGMSVADAIYEVSLLTGTKMQTQERFNQSRRIVAERVPEARRYLFSRDHKTRLH